MQCYFGSCTVPILWQSNECLLLKKKAAFSASLSIYISTWIKSLSLSQRVLPISCSTSLAPDSMAFSDDIFKSTWPSFDVKSARVKTSSPVGGTLDSPLAKRKHSTARQRASSMHEIIMEQGEHLNKRTHWKKANRETQGIHRRVRVQFAAEL